ncbi:hypothetical protein ES332_D13G056900v1 [Gossypium tomentosum]|uniref:Uncharacterized protein n=1 Tax=Gossypium tomentosum TaxID=34277 RepID=A0A5D2HT64_GOSTO|nr:hypothetical protein ES332_D13G056900v1 [Gossypium tomentosum]
MLRAPLFCVCLNLLQMQCGLKTPQCTIQGSLTKPADVTILRHKPKSCEFQTHKGDRIKVHYRVCWLQLDILFLYYKCSLDP